MPKAEPLSRCIMKDFGVSFSTISLLWRKIGVWGNITPLIKERKFVRE